MFKKTFSHSLLKSLNTAWCFSKTSRASCLPALSRVYYSITEFTASTSGQLVHIAPPECLSVDTAGRKRKSSLHRACFHGTYAKPRQKKNSPRNGDYFPWGPATQTFRPSLHLDIVKCSVGHLQTIKLAHCLSGVSWRVSPVETLSCLWSRLTCHCRRYYAAARNSAQWPVSRIDDGDCGSPWDNRTISRRAGRPPNLKGIKTGNE